MKLANSNSQNNKSVKPVLIEQELRESFLDYAMSVVVSRALPDIRDGLKPVHRRILFTMHQLGFHYNKSYHKSVRVVGEVLGKLHPHGDQAVYNSMVGLIQDFSKRYPLLDGQGNWGSIDGDNAAAMRYTEVRMAKITQELLADIEKKTVTFVPNFDESTAEPIVLPSKLPNLLVNGVAGIAVGMATSIPPHNLGEVVDGCLAFLENENLSDEELFEIIPAPDFPTGGIICGRSGIVKAYKTGRGKVILRAVVDFEETKKGITSLVITELPYQVNKADLAMKIAGLVKNKIIDGITNIKDESDKKGMRLIIELKRSEIPMVVLNQLYKHTNLQTSFSILMLGLLDNQPLVFSLRELLQEFLYHRKQIIYRRTIFDLEKAQEREHILTGFIVVLNNVDEVIALIKKSPSVPEAIVLLNKRFLLTEKQGKAILEMRLQRLTGLEQEKIYSEMEEIKKTIAYLQAIVESEALLTQEIIKELQKIKEAYADERRSRIEGAIDILTEADLIPDEEVVVTLTMKGYIKRVPLLVYGIQRRGGKGKMGMTALEGDVVQDIFVTKNHDMLLFFTNLGRVYSLQVFELPEASRIARGRAIVNLLPLQEGEQVVKLLPARGMEGQCVVMVTKNGIIKRTKATDFAKIRSTGIRAITLRTDDELVFCSLSGGNDTIIIGTTHGQGIRFNEGEVRVMGRQASGVIGIRLKKDDLVVGMEIIKDDGEILFATENGYGKKVRIKDFRIAIHLQALLRGRNTLIVYIIRTMLTIVLRLFALVFLSNSFMLARKKSNMLTHKREITMYHHSPLFNIDKTFEENCSQGPFFTGTIPNRVWPAKKDWRNLCGYPIASPVGIAACPITGNSKGIALSSCLGFDVITYKTIRYNARSVRPFPNITHVDIKKQLSLGDSMTTVSAAPIPAADLEQLAIANSIGNASSDRETAAQNIGQARKSLKAGQVLIVSVYGTQTADTTIVDDFSRIAAFACDAGAHIIEANFSCPNVGAKGGLLYLDPDMVYQIASQMVTICKDIPLIIKVSAFSSKEVMREVLRAAARAGVRGICGINSIPMCVVDVNGQSFFGPDRKISGISGAPIRDLAHSFVQNVRSIIDKEKLDLAILATGGITTYEHISLFLNAGADVALSATGVMWNPYLAINYHNQLSIKDRNEATKQKGKAIQI